MGQFQIDLKKQLTHYRESQNQRPNPNLSLSLLAIFGELDTPEAVKANVRAIRHILDQARRRDYTAKVYPNGRHPDGGSP